MMEEDLVTRLRKRAEIRRSIHTRKSVQEGAPDRIADLLEEAADALENKVEETLDEDEDDVVNYILIEEDSNGLITWDSSYETLDEFFEVLNVVAEEVQQPIVVTYPLH